MTMRVTTLAVWACFGLYSAFAVAQSSRTSTTGGVSQLTPQQATSLTGSTGASGSTGATSSGAGSRTSGAGGAGAQSQTGTGTEPEFNAGDGSVGAQVGQNGFTGRTNAGFAGNRNAGQTGGTSLTPQFNQMNNTQQQGNRGNTGNSNIKRARPQQRIAFTYPKANLAATQVQLGERFKRLSGVSGVGTSISDEGVARLTGSVTSEDSKKLAEALARLEPGVRSVVNELQVNSVSP